MARHRTRRGVTSHRCAKLSGKPPKLKRFIFSAFFPPGQSGYRCIGSVFHCDGITIHYNIYLPFELVQPARPDIRHEEVVLARHLDRAPPCRAPNKSAARMSLTKARKITQKHSNSDILAREGAKAKGEPFEAGVHSRWSFGAASECRKAVPKVPLY